ncbi:hypothetical protein M378DRAFT_163483 [Amanita muscaria Koide BX008]|uniref:Uncharacterized protein n=1 Tax=Amanita muscaria (strain Koide BX008) TaxID=946122 RepID=A0A0C2X680_AMAMK|nr:hypothetical protein M378DRAFT_163483 [Amanita muscaria Koide BX008]
MDNNFNDPRGYSRPLEASDLYKLQDNRSSSKIAAAINESYNRRAKVAAEYNARGNLPWPESLLVDD